MNVDRFSYMQVQVSATNGIQTHILVQIGSTNCIQKPFVDTKYNQNYVDTFTYQQLGTTLCKLYNVDTFLCITVQPGAMIIIQEQLGASRCNKN